MPRSSDGEFELVLGNKQLLSLFFLVVVLFAVFFSLGYMVGKSVSPAPTIAAKPTETPTSAVAPAAPSPLPEPIKEAPAPAAEPPSPAPPIETQPARTETVAAIAPPAVPAAAPPAAGTVAPAGGALPSPAATVPAAPREIHLQVAAVRVKADAEALAGVLRRKGYAVALNGDAGDGWYRVLVGPFASDKDAQDAKARLETDGYKSILKKP